MGKLFRCDGQNGGVSATEAHCRHGCWEHAPLSFLLGPKGNRCSMSFFIVVVSSLRISPGFWQDQQLMKCQKVVHVSLFCACFIFFCVLVFSPWFLVCFSLLRSESPGRSVHGVFRGSICGVRRQCREFVGCHGSSLAFMMDQEKRHKKNQSKLGRDIRFRCTDSGGDRILHGLLPMPSLFTRLPVSIHFLHPLLHHVISHQATQVPLPHASELTCPGRVNRCVSKRRTWPRSCWRRSRGAPRSKETVVDLRG